MLESKIEINDIIIDYIIQRKKIKNIYFRVKEDKKLYITCNILVSKNYIDKMLLKNQELILKMYQKMDAKTNDNIFYLGNELTLIISNAKPYIENNYIYASTKEDAKNYIYSLAYNIFLSRLNQLLHQFDDLPRFALKTRHMTSKWGVCNKKSMSITLNTELVKKDVNLIDYVIIHEICHLKYMDHSVKYWQYVSQFYPYYKRARKELNS